MKRSALRRAGEGIVLLAVALLASGCGPDPRVAPLREEISRLEKERVERLAVERAREEADAADRELGAAHSELDALRARVDELAVEREQIAASLSHAEASVARAQAATAAVRRQIEETASRGRALDAEIARVRGRAALVRAQLAVLERELRDDDPAWATDRRRRTLDETLQRAAHTWPDDPWLAERVAAPHRETEGVDRAREDARRAIAHLEAVYELGGDASESSAPR